MHSGQLPRGAPPPCSLAPVQRCLKAEGAQGTHKAGFAAEDTHTHCFLCRHCALPLVCCRFWRLANGPRLLQDVSISLLGTGLAGGDELLMQRQQSFASWLLRWAPGHVQLLNLDLHAQVEPASAAALPCRKTEFDQTVVAVVAGCGLASSLTRLQLTLRDTSFVLGSWAVPALSTIRRLSLTVFRSADRDAQPVAPEAPCLLAVAASLRSLSRLVHLSLMGGAYYKGQLLLPHGVVLPASLTKLTIVGADRESIVEQVWGGCLAVPGGVGPVMWL